MKSEFDPHPHEIAAIILMRNGIRDFKLRQSHDGLSAKIVKRNCTLQSIFRARRHLNWCGIEITFIFCNSLEH